MTVLLVLLLVLVLLGVASWIAPKGWRTVAFNVLAAIAAVAAPVLDALSGVDLSALLTKDEAAAFAIGVAVANSVLRAITTTPLGERR